MIAVGDKVQVTDQEPPAVGVVIAISTWKLVDGLFSSEDRCYKVHCDEWRLPLWIAAAFIRKIPS